MWYVIGGIPLVLALWWAWGIRKAWKEMTKQ